MSVSGFHDGLLGVIPKALQIIPTSCISTLPSWFKSPTRCSVAKMMMLKLKSVTPMMSSDICNVSVIGTLFPGAMGFPS